MFIDEIEITLKAGNGGNGKVSFFPGRKSGPDGGSGGMGGNLVARASANITNLNQYLGKNTIAAENGMDGSSREKTGADGKELALNLPTGSLMIDTDTQEEIELIKEGSKILICKGGFGGRGNSEFKSSLNTTPREAEKGEIGQSRSFKILVRMIADFGLVGLPNAGKSSLLNELTNARVAVASYPFTTLQPNLGVFNHKVIADIPGLIEGASQGKGLGIKFLKHIEKVKLLLHCISSQSQIVAEEYKTVMNELEKYNPQLIQKKQIVLLTKSDLISQSQLDKKIRDLKKFQEIILPVSIYDWDSLQALKNLLEIF